MGVAQGPVLAMVTAITDHQLFFSMLQVVGHADVGNLGGSELYAVDQATVHVNTDVDLDSEVPLIALLRLAHLRVALALLILG